MTIWRSILLNFFLLRTWTCVGMNASIYIPYIVLNASCIRVHFILPSASTKCALTLIIAFQSTSHLASLGIHPSPNHPEFIHILLKCNSKSCNRNHHQSASVPFGHFFFSKCLNILLHAMKQQHLLNDLIFYFSCYHKILIGCAHVSRVLILLGIDSELDNQSNVMKSISHAF